MSYGFIKTMKENPNQSYVEVSPVFPETYTSFYK
jgi:hypothetical protein